MSANGLLLFLNQTRLIITSSCKTSSILISGKAIWFKSVSSVLECNTPRAVPTAITLKCLANPFSKASVFLSGSYNLFQDSASILKNNLISSSIKGVCLSSDSNRNNVETTTTLFSTCVPKDSSVRTLNGTSDLYMSFRTANCSVMILVNLKRIGSFMRHHSCLFENLCMTRNHQK